MIQAARIGSAIYRAPQSCWRWIVTELTDFSGRLTPWQFRNTLGKRFGALMPVLVACIGVTIYLAFTWRDSKIVYSFDYAFWAFVALFALLSVRPMIRRFHDLNLSAWSAIAYAWAVIVSYTLAQRISTVTYTSTGNDSTDTSTTTITYPESLQDWAFFGLCSIPMLFMFVLLFWGGTNGSNRYGPQPE